MNDHTVYSDEQAALLEAHSHASALAQRYAHACDVLLDDDELKDRFDARRRELEGDCERLEARIREQDLLPHDVNVDREDLARLADRFREWLDHERHTHLQHALAKREADLLDCLEALRKTGFEDETLDQASASGRRMMERLERG